MKQITKQDIENLKELVSYANPYSCGAASKELVDSSKRIFAYLKKAIKTTTTIHLRSKVDPSFQLNLVYKNDVLTKNTIQGDCREKINDKQWLELIRNTAIGTKLDYDKLKLMLLAVPEVYVEKWRVE